MYVYIFDTLSVPQKEVSVISIDNDFLSLRRLWIYEMINELGKNQMLKHKVSIGEYDV